MLEALKNFNTTTGSIDEMVSLRAYARGLIAEYEIQEVDIPEFVKIQSKNLDRQIAAKNEERLHARRREIVARMENMKSPAERRSEAKRELAQLDRKLKTSVGKNILVSSTPLCRSETDRAAGGGGVR
jgi:hypothetical protein